jgi:hypothetical protein
VAVLFGATPFYRYLLGMHLIDTGGSVLAAAVTGWMGGISGTQVLKPLSYGSRSRVGK